MNVKNSHSDQIGDDVYYSFVRRLPKKRTFDDDSDTETSSSKPPEAINTVSGAIDLFNETAQSQSNTQSSQSVHVDRNSVDGFSSIIDLTTVKRTTLNQSHLFINDPFVSNLPGK